MGYPVPYERTGCPLPMNGRAVLPNLSFRGGTTRNLKCLAWNRRGSLDSSLRCATLGMTGGSAGENATMLVDNHSGFRLGGRNDGVALGRAVLTAFAGPARLAVRPEGNRRSGGQPGVVLNGRAGPHPLSFRGACDEESKVPPSSHDERTRTWNGATGNGVESVNSTAAVNNHFRFLSPLRYARNDRLRRWENATVSVDNHSGFRLGGRNDGVALGRAVLTAFAGPARLAVRPEGNRRSGGQPGVVLNGRAVLPNLSFRGACDEESKVHAPNPPAHPFPLREPQDERMGCPRPGPTRHSRGGGNLASPLLRGSGSGSGIDGCGEAAP